MKSVTTVLDRFSIAVESSLLRKFDSFISKRGYRNRSEAVRDLIRRAFVQEEWNTNDEVIGIVTLTYDHHSSRLLENIMEVQHSHVHNIISTTHIHIDHDNCLESIIAKGRAGDIRELADSLTSLKGVKTGVLSMASTGRRI